MEQKLSATLVPGSASFMDIGGYVCFTQSCCIIEVCLHAQSEDPAVYACVFALLLGCFPMFARMNTNWAKFLMARVAVVSKILPPRSLFLWSLNIDIALLLANFWCYSYPLTQPRVIWFCVMSNNVTPPLNCFLVTLNTGRSVSTAGLLSWAMSIMGISAPLYASLLLVFVSFDP